MRHPVSISDDKVATNYSSSINGWRAHSENEAAAMGHATKSYLHMLVKKQMCEKDRF